MHIHYQYSMITTVKRPLKLRNVSKNNLCAFNNLIQDANLFIHNIYLFISSYYIYYFDNSKLNSSGILTIFKILMLGDNYDDKDCKFYKFLHIILHDIFYIILFCSSRRK